MTTSGSNGSTCRAQATTGDRANTLLEQQQTPEVHRRRCTRMARADSARWKARSCHGPCTTCQAENPDSLDTMKDYFRRFRAARQKTIEGAEYEALQRSWCAMIKRWNRMQYMGQSFVSWLLYREEILKEYSLTELRERVCENAWAEDRSCYDQLREGCRVCGESRRPTQDEWAQHVAERPLSAAESAWIAKYERTLSNISNTAFHGGSRTPRSARSASPACARPRTRSRSPRGAPRELSPSRGRNHSRERHLEHHGGDWRVAPTYPPREETQANERGIYVRQEQPWRSDGRERTRGWDPYDRRFDPLSRESRPPNQQSAEERYGGTVPDFAAHDAEKIALRGLRHS
ncbi:hypothetical protein L917_06030 [Phytophthora nicotianae]|uniref:Uncharacterized protein n=1 Tax=Phytophthora nicotianae TaxID=4792 RepID=W2LIE8_PHYNI|nr:hypothetical protein L917_06030 [Phytophthora nicotianae]